MRFKRSLVVALLTSMLPVGAAVHAAPLSPTAPAGHSPDHLVETDSYSSYRMAWVDKFNFCLGIWVTGKIRADVYFTPIEGGAYATMTNPRVIDPRMLVTIKKSCDDSSSVKTYHAANVVNYRTYFYGNKCDYNPSFSASYPWGVSVGITPDCGQKTVARYGETQTNARRAYRFELDTDGYAFKWDKRDTNTQPTTIKFCSSVSSFFVLKDTQGAVRRTVQKKVGFPDACVTYSYF
jgi:hypothetical protein